MADPNSLEAPAEYIDPAGMRDDDETPQQAPAQFAISRHANARPTPPAERTGASAKLDRLDLDAEADRVLALLKERSATLLWQLQAEVARRPRLLVGVGLGLTVVALLASVYGLRRRRPRWRRELEAYRRALAEGVQFRIRVPSELP